MSEKIERFMDSCERFGMSRECAEKLLEDTSLTALECIEVVKTIKRYQNGCYYTMKVLAAKKAVDDAKTLADWIAIAEHTNGRNREIAFSKIHGFRNLSNDDVQLLVRSRSSKLNAIGWYLNSEPSI